MTDGDGTRTEGETRASGTRSALPAAEELALTGRLRRLRRDHPAAEITTEHIRLDETIAVFRATIVVPDGGKATGYGSAAPQLGGDVSYVETAESRSVSRALTALGFQPTLIEEAAPVTAPPGEHAPTSRLTPMPGRQSGGSEERPPAPSAEPGPSHGGHRAGTSAPAEPRPVTRPTTAPVELGASRERSSGASPRGERPAPVRPVPNPEPANGEPDLADYSFTSFWKWARELGYNSKGAIEELIGQPMAGLSPLELRRRVLIARGDIRPSDD